MSISRVLNGTRQDLLSSVDDAISFLQSSNDWRRKASNAYRPILQKHRYDIAGLSFFRMYLAWEEFLEEAFLILLVKAKKGTRGARSLLEVKTKKDALKIIKGDKRYLEWGGPKDVKERAKILFKDGRPFDVPLAGAMLHLERMRIIRNRIAHRSEHADQRFKDLIRDLYGAYRRETPGSLLLLSTPGSFGLPPGVIAGPTVIQTYADILKSLGHQITR